MKPTMIFKVLAALLAAFFIGSAQAQWQTPTNSIPVGRGAGTGFNSAGPGTNNQVLIGNTGAAPTFSSPTGWFDGAYCSTIGYLIVRFTGAWTCDNSIPGSVKWWGATGNGSTDDTTNVQAALTAMQAVGGNAYFPAGCYKITTGLTVSGRIKISGSGYQGDSGGGFAGHGVTACGASSGSVVVCATTINCLVATTNLSVQIENLQFSYLSAASAGTSAITIQAVAGAGNSNTQSSIHDVMVTGGDTGVTLTNALNFNFTDNHILYQITNGMVANSPNFPSFQQATISNNIFWGAANAGYSAHLSVQAGGDLRITNNKFSTGGVNTNSIALFGAASGSQNMEPMIIAGNSSEGAQNCITFNTANASFTASQIVITGNQLWCGGKSILINSFGVSQWVIGVTITGNVLTVNGGATVGNMSLDNLKNSTITGNTFNCSGGCSTSTGIVLASHTTGIVTGNNTFDAGFTTTVSNLAASGLNIINDIYCPPVVSVFTTGTNATLTPSTCAGNLPKFLDMEMVGGGGGGAGSGTTPGAAGAGGATCWNTGGTACTTPVYQSGGGAAGTVTAGTIVAGGTVTGSGTCDDAIAGAQGASGSNQANSFGGYGASSPYGGAGAAGFAVAGGAAAANSGSGGGGSGENATVGAGGGGAAGAFCRKLITPVAASYVYTIGIAGTAGTAGTGGTAGGAGAAGRLKTTQRWM